MNLGDYVRTYNGEIGIIINCPEELKKNYDNFLWFETRDEQRPIRKEDIIKSSPQIIDLIEVGDYVNGYRVDFTNITEKLSYEDKCIGFYDGDGDINLFEEDIKSIVTHEQFENIEYRVEE